MSLVDVVLLFVIVCVWMWVGLFNYCLILFVWFVWDMYVVYSMIMVSKKFCFNINFFLMYDFSVCYFFLLCSV